MHRRFSTTLLIITVTLAALTFGCGGGGGKNPATGYTGPTTTMNGTLTVPALLNNALLTSIRGSQNTDSDIRAAFASATVLVNGSIPGTVVISPNSSNSMWPIRLEGVPEAINDRYYLDVLARRFRLRAHVRTAQKDAFVINSRTTAAVLLEPGSAVEAPDLLATFPSVISVVALQIENAFNSPLASVTTDVLALPDITALVASQAAFVRNWGGFTPGALVAYLGRSNDLDNDGREDLRVIPSIDGTRVSFATVISSDTSLYNPTSYAQSPTLASYTDVTLLEDFRTGNTRTDRNFTREAVNFLIGLRFKRGATQDTYLKLLVRRTDMADGRFDGIAAEYQFVTTTGTAVSSGTKTFLMAGASPIVGAVTATDFLTDYPTASPTLLSYLDTTNGFGGSNMTVPLLRAENAKLDLTDIRQADEYTDTYYRTTSALALKDELGAARALQVGDLFTAYFPKTRHYAMFKITNINTVLQTITVDYYVNSTADELRFF